MPLVVDRYALGPLQTNCYVVRSDRNATEAAVIDPGGDAPDLRLELARLGASMRRESSSPTATSTTSAASPTSRRGPARRSGCRRASANGSSGSPEFAPAGVPGRAYAPEHLVSGGETIEVAGVSFECLAVPGHSPAHVAFYADGELFSGDLLFAGSVGRVDLPGADWDTLLASVRMLVDRFPPETVVHPGHGPETTLGDGARAQPFLAELRTEA